MKEKILIIIGLTLSGIIGFMLGQIFLIKTQKPTRIVQNVIDRSLDKYAIENLSKEIGDIKPAEIKITKTLKEFPEFTSNEFMMSFNPNLDGKTYKKVSGLINLPKNNDSTQKSLPLIIMIRGYVPSQMYFIGNGTINVSYYFAKNGFITMAPDFLGYGDSDKETANIFEARFQTYVTVLSLLKSIESIPNWDHKNIFLWAHSNGGQIALTTLEITQDEIPVSLWAPVSAPFPYSILYYSVDEEDKGKRLRKELAKFEEIYDTNLYSLDNYLDKIKAILQISQGTKDESVPIAWTDDLVKKLRSKKLQVTYNVYTGGDHQMTPHWNEAVQKDLEFFIAHQK